MDWILKDWEYPNDHIYAMERHHDMQLEWQQWEEEQKRNKRLPAIIKVEIPILTNEVQRNTRTFRRAHQKRL